jgi:predicted acyltransferase
MSDTQSAATEYTTDSRRPDRLVSIDVFRALMIAGMIFMENPASRHSVPATFIDSPWNGLTIADTIFPGFLFIVGVSMTMAFARKKYVAD